jgi:hypothetical protein
MKRSERKALSGGKRAKLDFVSEPESTRRDLLPVEPTWADDEEAPFPRGGGTELSALEHRAIARSAQADALAEQQEGKSARDRGSVYDAEAVNADAAGDSGLLRAHALHRKLCLPGLKLLGAVSDVSSERLLLQLPGRMVGRVSRAEISDEVHAIMEQGIAPPDLRKLFRCGLESQTGGHTEEPNWVGHSLPRHTPRSTPPVLGLP